MPPSPRTPRVLWIEAEHFAERGGWTTDAQFIDQMGSPYLLAVGRGTPVADAVTQIQAPHAGPWRLWVRCKDWAPGHHPGRFQVLVNGEAAGREFGASGQPGWRWEDGGVHALAGRVEIRLRDATGYYARCDALALSADPAWVPPDDLVALHALRAQHGEVSAGVEDAGPYDVVVVGGGLAGCTTAVAAARLGCRVALVQNRPLLGGNASTEILVPPVGVWPHGGTDPLDPRETGLVEEYRTAGNQRLSEGKLYSERLLRWVRQEPNLDLYLDTHATGVEMAGRRIAAVTALQVNTGSRSRFAGCVFVDATGDAVVGVAAGAEYRHGKEPRSLHDEPWAPEEASPHTMGNGLKYYHEDAGSPQPFAPPAWACRFESCEAFGPGRHPRFITNEEIDYQWILELGGLQDTYAEAEEIRDDLLRLIYGLWDHTKNHCARDREQAANHRLAWVGHVAGKRENRRLIGDHVLTQNDIGAQTLFPDRVAYGAWVVDDHHSGGFFHQGSFGKHYDDRRHAYQGLPFSVPFRSLYSRNVENLLMAGRNISATYLALADTRVMLTCAVIGQAAGTGAALCVAHNTTPRGIYEAHLAELQQQLLKDGAYLIDLPNRDPRDLARRANVTASGASAPPTPPTVVGGWGGRTADASAVTNGHARAEGGRANAWAPDPDAPPPHWVELSWDEPVHLSVAHVVFQTAARAPRGFVLEAWQGDGWQVVAEVSENRHRRQVLGLDRLSTNRLRIVLEEPRGVCEIRVYDEPEGAVETARRAHANVRRPDVGPFLPWEIGRSPEELAAARAHAPAGGAVVDAVRQRSGVVVDDRDADQIGDWRPSAWAERSVGEGYVTDGNTGKGEKEIRFRPTAPTAGDYEVWLAYSACENRASNAPVTVATTRETRTVRVDQRRPPEVDGLFHALGVFALDAGETPFVTVSNAGTDGYVVVDAIAVVPAA